MDSCTISKYGIVNRKTKLRMHYSSEIPPEKGVCRDSNSDELEVPAGTLIKYFQTNGPIKSGFKVWSTVQVRDFINSRPIYENLYECPLSNLTKVDENLWPFVIGIVDPDERLRLIINTDHCKWFLYLKENSLVSVPGEMFLKPGLRFDCIVRYIGPVKELQSVGYFFGLELLHLESGNSPQADNIPFSKEYIGCEPHLAIFATANYICNIPKDVQKKFSAREFISGTFEKLKSAIGPTSSVTGCIGSNSSSPKWNKATKGKGKESTSQFYDNLRDAILLSKNEMDTKSESSIVAQAAGGEDGKQVENYERSLERKSTNTVQTQTQPQSGILKNKNSKDQIKPSHVLAFGGPDIVVIDNKDIDESVRNEGAASSSNAKKMNDYVSGPNKSGDMKIQNAYDATNTLLPAVLDADFTESPMQELEDTGLGVGSMVEVNDPESDSHLYGVIRWIGVPPGSHPVMVGVELEEDYINKQLITTDGGFNGISLFKCPVGRGLFVTPDQCSCDRRFLAEEGAIGNDVSVANNNYKTKQMNGTQDEQQTFGHMDCPVVPGAIAPIKCFSSKDLEELCGKFKGIQGHHNSCYLDVTLFSMFTFTPVFDAVLYRPPEKEDISSYAEVQTVLREEIVNPLRKNMFVRADRVMKLRQLLDKLSSVSGLTSEEKDPEEFLNCILAQILRAEPFLKLNSGQDAYYYQLFVEKDDRLSFPSVQQLFEQSFYTSDIKLKEVPSCLIIQMPRFGKNYKMYPRILPSQVLDVTDIIEDSPRQCSVCGKLAEFECRDCFGVLQSGVGLESTSFCPKCLETVHMHVKRSNHKYRELSVPQDFRVMANHMTVPRLYMELFAVVCIETSHYVTFVKAGSGPDAPWCFFDSMADRKGEQNGYNIPEMITVPDLPQWLSEEGSRIVNETSANDKMLPEHAKRLFCDAYMCMYQSTDVMMYR
ncbi:ubiquitin carboxyl-terminal hydrolase CYLD isoform X3 [Stomoxys calcitrans]|uniref:ubiquitin carboxyl-terminal hydrolase CYLD isoform X3 n=1 Tax=Stomoxys calcitrans TaxID=35570 RepID=UPI0027E34FA6|nr:ubiquitin carboxyl-terminal hydrolase CYLD isoform X3 [Stomoxys calcitrans]